MSDPIKIHPAGSAPAALGEAQTRSLRCVVGLMIPASAAHGVPGADDERIFADILASLGRETEAVRKALEEIDALADGDFAAKPRGEQIAVLERFRAHPSSRLTVLVNATVRCYYRDDRVMVSLGMEPRPPFPKGFEVPQGDWSLLEPVRARGPIWREVP